MYKLNLAISALLLIGFTLAHRVTDLSDNFDSKIKDFDVVLVKFFAPWCGHCKNLAPIFEQASEKLKAGALAEVDCTTNGGKVTCEKYGISGYPTLKLFRKGQFSKDCNEARSVPAIVKFVERHALPAISEISSLAEFDTLMNDKQTMNGIAFGFFENEHETGLNEFKAIADFDKKVRFAYSTNKDVLSKSNFKNQIVFYTAAILKSPKLEPTEVVYSGSLKSQNEISDFILNNKYGLCGIRSGDNVNDFGAEYLVVVYTDMDIVKKAKNILYVRNRVLKAAKGLVDKPIKFAISDIREFQHELKSASVESDPSKNFVVLYEKKNEHKFRMDGQFSSDNIVSFVKDVIDGKIEATIRSEPIPEDPVEDHVYVAVARTFKSLVMDSDKDVLIEFYAPWCGHCKSLAPILSDVAKELSDESIIIAKMNAVENDVPRQFEVRGFPTMYFLPKNDKNNPIRYNAGRNKMDFIKFFAKHSTDPLKRYNRDGSEISTDKEL